MLETPTHLRELHEALVRACHAGAPRDLLLYEVCWALSPEVASSLPTPKPSLSHMRLVADVQTAMIRATNAGLSVAVLSATFAAGLHHPATVH